MANVRVQSGPMVIILSLKLKFASSDFGVEWRENAGSEMSVCRTIFRWFLRFWRGGGADGRNVRIESVWPLSRRYTTALVNVYALAVVRKCADAPQCRLVSRRTFSPNRSSVNGGDCGRECNASVCTVRVSCTFVFVIINVPYGRLSGTFSPRDGQFYPVFLPNFFRFGWLLAYFWTAAIFIWSS